MTQEKQLTERTVSGFFWNLTASGSQVILRLGVLSALARLIGPKEFGLVGIALIIIEFSKTFTQMGVGAAIVQRKELKNSHLTTGLTLSLLIGLFFFALLFFLSPFLAKFFHKEELVSIIRAISVIFLIDSLTLIGQAMMQRNMKFKTIAIIDILSYAIGYGITGVVLAYLGWGVWSLVIANIAKAILQATLIAIYQPFQKRLTLKKQELKELIHLGGGITIARLGHFLGTNSDNLIIGRMLGTEALGYYGRSYQFSILPAGLFGTTIDKTLFPAMAKIQDNKSRLGQVYIGSVSIVALLALPLSIMFILLAPEIVMLLLGSKWTAVILPFQILSAGLVFRMSYQMSESLSRATGAVYGGAWRHLVYAAIVLISSSIGQFFGISGVACGVVIALIINFLMMGHLSIKITGIRWIDLFKAHRYGLRLGLTTGIYNYALLTLCRMYFDSPFLILVITCSTLSLLLFLTIRHFSVFYIRETDKELFNNLIAKRFNFIKQKNKKAD